MPIEVYTEPSKRSSYREQAGNHETEVLEEQGLRLLLKIGKQTISTEVAHPQALFTRCGNRRHVTSIDSIAQGVEIVSTDVTLEKRVHPLDQEVSQEHLNHVGSGWMPTWPAGIRGAGGMSIIRTTPRTGPPSQEPLFGVPRLFKEAYLREVGLRNVNWQGERRFGLKVE